MSCDSFGPDWKSDPIDPKYELISFFSLPRRTTTTTTLLLLRSRDDDDDVVVVVVVVV
tara:strand:+ start:402 stop:575 length:174 start_codon:yes stop_codon:yes gene_type:complete